MKFYLRFLLVWIVNSVVILLANQFYGRYFVLGNAVLTPMMAGILTGFLLTVLTRSIKPVLTRFGLAKKGRVVMFVKYWFINSIIIWILARLSVITGFGIPAFYWAFVLGITASLGQWIMRQVFKNFKLIEK